MLIHSFCTIRTNSTVAELGIGRALTWTELEIVFGRWAVPVFLMITGTLLLDPARTLGINKISKYVSRIAMVLLVFGTGYALMELVFSERTLNLAMLPAAFLRMLEAKSWDHMWYLYDLLGIYLLLPLLRSFVSSADRDTYRRTLLMLFIFCCIIPTVNRAFSVDIKNVLWLGSSILYVLLGRYLSTYARASRGLFALAAASLAAEAILAAVGILTFGVYWAYLWSPSSPFVVIYSAALFAFAKQGLNRPMKAGGAAQALSRLSFAVYLVHPIFANLLYKALDWVAAPLPSVVFEIVTYLLILIPSLAFSAVLVRVPGFRKLL